MDCTICGFTATGDMTSTNLQLAPLGDYGGPTWTKMPLPGSPTMNDSVAEIKMSSCQMAVTKSVGHGRITLPFYQA